MLALELSLLISEPQPSRFAWFWVARRGIAVRAERKLGWERPKCALSA